MRPSVLVLGCALTAAGSFGCAQITGFDREYLETGGSGDSSTDTPSSTSATGVGGASTTGSAGASGTASGGAQASSSGEGAGSGQASGSAGGNQDGACTQDDQCPASGAACEVPSCIQGTCGVAPAPVGSACNANDGKVCSSEGACVACNVDADCAPAGSDCVQQVCSSSSCNANGTKDDLETDIDCGGPDCPACLGGALCQDDADCATSNCLATQHCSPFSCSNGSKNQAAGETDVDCGGNVCKKCAAGKACEVDSDCLSGSCPALVCS